MRIISIGSTTIQNPEQFLIPSQTCPKQDAQPVASLNAVRIHTVAMTILSVTDSLNDAVLNSLLNVHII